MVKFINNVCEHIDIEHFRKGMCERCYLRSKRKTLIQHLSAKCHSNRSMYHKDGLCQPCYRKRYLYGVDFITLYIEQEGRCKLCSEEFAEDKLVIDHNHTTDKVRGLVCYPCNAAIGGAENPMLIRALDYLLRNN